MMSRNLLTSSMLALVITTATAGTASASIVEDVFTGVVTSGSDTAGVFGSAGSNLEGESFIATFLFDDNRGDKITYDTPYAVGQSILGNTYYSPALGATLTINDHTYFFSGGGEDSGYFVDQGGYVFDEDVASATSIVSLIESGGDSSEIPGSFETPFTADLLPFFDQEFHIGLDLSDGSSMATGILDDTSVTALVFPGPPPPAAPEPSAWALMVLGLGGVGAMMRARRLKQATPA